MSPAWDKTKLENKYEKYWEIQEAEWHRRIPQEYHASQIGIDNSDLPPKEHYGPDLLETFFDYVNYLEYNTHSKGNMKMGTILHKEQEEIYKKRKPLTFPEFPLQFLLYNEKTERNIRLLGTLDIGDQRMLPITSNPDNPIELRIYDIKTCSEYTIPHHKNDTNPTYFGQLGIYAYWVDNFYFNSDFIKVTEIGNIFIDKQNCGTYELFKPYDSEFGKKCWKEFTERAKLLDLHIHKFQRLKKNKDKFGKEEFRALLNDIMPKHEPFKWTKYSKYLPRIFHNVFDDSFIQNYDEEQLQKRFEEETGKHAIWNGRITKGYTRWKEERGYD